jgi:hypothetical protein
MPNSIREDTVDGAFPKASGAKISAELAYHGLQSTLQSGVLSRQEQLDSFYFQTNSNWAI